ISEVPFGRIELRPGRRLPSLLPRLGERAGGEGKRDVRQPAKQQYLQDAAPTAPISLHQFAGFAGFWAFLQSPPTRPSPWAFKVSRFRIGIRCSVFDVPLCSFHITQ